MIFKPVWSDSSDHFWDRVSGWVSRVVLSLQADNLPEMPPQSVTEEAYTDQHGNMVVKKVRRPPDKSRRREDLLFRGSVSSTRSHAR